MRAGYSFEDVRYKYTIPQVWLFFEEEKKRILTAQKELAIVIANATTISHPADSQKAANEKMRNWEKFIDSLDWETLEKKTETKVDPIKAFSSIFGK